MDTQLQALVVDDSQAMRQNVVDVLTTMQRFEITQAVDGADALKKLKHRKFDIVVTDINMPTMDGLKLTEMVRRDPPHEKVPVVIITSENTDKDRARALALGANAYLLKPANGPEIVATLTRLLKLSPTRV